jgi:hypothetical protein
MTTTTAPDDGGKDNSMHQQSVFEAIASERAYQDRKWGTPAEHPHEVGGWLALMSVHLRRAQEAWASANSDAEALESLRKVLAIGVACGEQHGLRGRARAHSVSQRMRGDGYQRTPSSE